MAESREDAREDRRPRQVRAEESELRARGFLSRDALQANRRSEEGARRLQESRGDESAKPRRRSGGTPPQHARRNETAARCRSTERRPPEQAERVRYARRAFWKAV